MGNDLGYRTMVAASMGMLAKKLDDISLEVHHLFEKMEPGFNKKELDSMETKLKKMRDWLDGTAQYYEAGEVSVEDDNSMEE